jgi:hypothetical protein
MLSIKEIIMTVKHRFANIFNIYILSFVGDFTEF